MSDPKKGFRQKPAPTKAQQNKKSALERIDGLEQAYQGLVDGINAVLQSNGKRVAMLERAMGAVIEAVGIEQVQAILEEKNRREQAERDASLKALVDQSLETGEIVVTDTIAEDSLIVGVEKNADGDPISGRAQLSFSEVGPDFKAELLGKGVGTVIATKPRDEQGNELPPGTFEVQEIYKVLGPKQEPEAAAGEPPQGATHEDQVAQAEAQ